jgi:glycosyltransferase involved in cell wall biosynthesis
MSKRGTPELIAWGSYDESKPRVRLLLECLRRSGALAEEINIAAWEGVRDKTVASPGRLAKAVIRLLLSYPGALIRLVRLPKNRAILLAYPAIPDIFAAWPIARLKRQHIVFDAFVPVHDTLVGDRALVRKGGLAGKVIWLIERTALRLADIILVDTDQHGDFYSREFGIPRERLQTILVGAETTFWSRPPATPSEPTDPSRRQNPPNILFYGQLSPLHGLRTILEAIRLTAGERLHWQLIGSGQDEPLIRDFLEEHGGAGVTWVPWMDYGGLSKAIRSADLALGIFGTSDKAARVIPNKMFQIMAAGKTVITRASPAVDSIAARYPEAVITVPPGNGAALAEAVRKALREPEKLGAVPSEAEADLGPASGVQALLARLALERE